MDSHLQNLEEQVVELEERLNTLLLRLDELEHKLPTTTTSGDLEIHHHHQAHKSHTTNAELLAEAATAAATTHCITMSSQSDKLGFNSLPSDHQPPAPPAMNDAKEGREGERSTKLPCSLTGSSRHKCIKEAHLVCLFKKLGTWETRLALAAIISIVGISTMLALVPTPSLRRRI